MNLITTDVPGTSRLKKYPPDDFVLCEEHKSIKLMFNILIEGELVPACGQCFLEECPPDKLGEARPKAKFQESHPVKGQN